jgi:hypothetical protein
MRVFRRTCNSPVCVFPIVHKPRWGVGDGKRAYACEGSGGWANGWSARDWECRSGLARACVRRARERVRGAGGAGVVRE